MIRKSLETPKGTIRYWVSQERAGVVVGAAAATTPLTLVMLPGLTADHRLFEKQIACFKGQSPLLLWDAPGHGESRPFSLDFTLADKARWLHDILQQEGITRPVLIGQSMGGYVTQSFMQEFPGEAAGFVSIDSAPLQRAFYAGWELWSLKITEPCYRWYPWEPLVRAAAKGNAETAYGQELMTAFMRDFSHREYAALAGHGFRLLAKAVERNLPYGIDCPALLLCGEQDKAGFTRRYNQAWADRTGLPLRWVPGAGHNSNTDNPAFVNEAIGEFLATLA